MNKTNSSWLKTFSIGFSIISFGITIAIIGYIVLTTKQNQNVVQPSPTSTIDETANWKIYKNDQLKFEFKYPPNWNYHPGIDSPAWSVNNYQKNGYFSVNLYRNDLGCLRQKIYTYQGRTTWKEVKESETLIGSHKASLIEGKAKITGYSDPQLNRELDYKIILLSKGLDCYDLSTQAYKGATNETKKNLDQILSTFQFSD